MITLPRCLQSRGVVQIVVSFNKRAVIEATLRDLGVLDCFLAIHDGNDVKVVSPKYSVRTALTLRAGLQPPPFPAERSIRSTGSQDQRGPYASTLTQAQLGWTRCHLYLH